MIQNRFQFIGNLGRDAETKNTSSGVPVTDIALAVTVRNKKGDDWVNETQWFNLTMWRREGLAQYLTKGTRIAVEGHIVPRTWEKDGEKRYGHSFVVDEIVLLGGGKGGAVTATETEESFEPVPDDDVPF